MLWRTPLMFRPALFSFTLLLAATACVSSRDTVALRDPTRKLPGEKTEVVAARPSTFIITEREKPLVRVLVNGVEGLFVLDTGSTFTAAYEHFRAKAGLGAMVGAHNATTTHGAVSMEVAEAGRIQVANVSVKSFLINIAPSGSAVRFSKATGTPLPDGILGADILKRFGAVIDFGRNTLVFRPAETPNTGSRVVARLLELPMNGIGVEAAIDDMQALLSIDSGRNSFGSVYTDIPLVRSLQTVPIALQRSYTLGAVREENEAYLAKRLVLGPILAADCVLAREPAELAWRPKKLPRGITRLIDGFLGISFLRAHGLTVDYGRMEILQRPES